MSYELTILIPTYNRYPHLKRLLSYYQNQGFPFPIYIADSSSDVIKDEKLLSMLKTATIEWRKFDTKVPFPEKVLQALCEVTTTFVVLCADDDFITVSGMRASVNFLEKNTDYSCAHGRYFYFDVTGQKKYPVMVGRFGNEHSIEHEDASLRFESHLANYEATFYGVHNTKQLVAFFKETIVLTSESRFGELIPTTLAAIEGKIKVLDLLYNCRECSAISDSQSGLSWKNVLEEPNFQIKYYKIINRLSVALNQKSQMSSKCSSKLVKKTMGDYLIKSAGRKVFFLKVNNFYGLIFGILTMCKFTKKNLTKKSCNNAINRNNVPWLQIQNPPPNFISEIEIIEPIIRDFFASTQNKSI